MAFADLTEQALVNERARASVWTIRSTSFASAWGISGQKSHQNFHKRTVSICLGHGYYTLGPMWTRSKGAQAKYWDMRKNTFGRGATWKHPQSLTPP
jgi:hypothetical protein